MESERNLHGFLGGVAESGARFKIEIVKTDAGFTARSASAGGSSAWTAFTVVADSPDLVTVIKKASAKFASKTVPGRDRAYTRPMNGGPPAGPFPKGLDELPDHPLCWKVGRPLSLLPSELRYRAVLAEGQPPDDDSMPPPSSLVSAGEDGEHPPLGQVVMLCETIPDLASLELLIGLEQWVMTEKMEGDRAQLHVDEDGMVYLTKRSGALANCPPHIALAMERQQPGTSLDGELITVSEKGEAQLRVGARATIQLFVAFDLLAHPDMPDGMETPQIRRLALLAELLPPFQPPLAPDGPAIRCVPHAWTEGGKRLLLAEIRGRHGEGVVMRSAPSRYEGRRSHSWQRYCDQERTLDAVVMGYSAGTGNIAGLVGGVEVGLFDGEGGLHSLGFVGSGWTRAQRRELQDRWDAGMTGYVVTVKTYGLSFADQVTRASGVRIRAANDKRPHECLFTSEMGRPYNLMGQALDA